VGSIIFEPSVIGTGNLLVVRGAGAAVVEFPFGRWTVCGAVSSGSFFSSLLRPFFSTAGFLFSSTGSSGTNSCSFSFSLGFFFFTAFVVGVGDSLKASAAVRFLSSPFSFFTLFVAFGTGASSFTGAGSACVVDSLLLVLLLNANPHSKPSSSVFTGFFRF
jgi:hypothetical protein